MFYRSLEKEKSVEAQASGESLLAAVMTLGLDQEERVGFVYRERTVSPGNIA